MIIRGPRPTGNFYILDKAISEDVRLTWAARGMLIFLLGKPDHWRASPAALVNETQSSRKQSGRDAVWALLKELIEAGYCTRIPMRNPDGTMGAMSYSIQETPCAAYPPRTAYPGTAEPCTANPTQVSTDPLASIEGKQELSSNARGKKALQLGFDLTTGTFTNIDALRALNLKTAYPSLRLDAEINRAAIWIIANPSKRPTGNFARFITSWLARAQKDADNKPRSKPSASDILTGRAYKPAPFTGETFDA